MTNKLPKIGRRYRRINPVENSILNEIEFIHLETNYDEGVIWAVHKKGKMKLDFLYENYEEITAEEKPITSDPKPTENAVEKAKEELKKHLNLKEEELDWKTAANFGAITANLAHALLNALDAQEKPRDCSSEYSCSYPKCRCFEKKKPAH